MTDCETVILSASKEKYNVYNLLKATNYYVRVTALLDSGESKIAETSFRTTDLGPRVLNVGGIYNVRDLGGYLLESGERTLQGKIFRGGALSKSADTAYDYVKLNDKGAAFMSETLGIKTDFDLRNAQENLGLTETRYPAPSSNTMLAARIPRHLPIKRFSQKCSRLFRTKPDTPYISIVRAVRTERARLLSF